MSKKYISIFVLFLLLVTCASMNDVKNNRIKGNKRASTNKIDKLRQKVVNIALSYENKKLKSRVSVNGKNFMLDCSGAVAAIYYSVGIDVTKDYGKFSGNGVKRLYLALESKGLLANRKDNPLPGDVIFWDNTYDKNEDKYFGNDPLTHTAVVVGVEDDGTIQYLHAIY